MNHATSVVILRSGHHGGLGIVRSLGRLGVPVYSVDATIGNRLSVPGTAAADLF